MSNKVTTSAKTNKKKKQLQPATSDRKKFLNKKLDIDSINENLV